ncbi:MAG: PaaI family thioesterase [Marmoricola sp.]
MAEVAYNALLSGWRREQETPRPEGSSLPSHHSHCLGCGPDNPHGHHLVVLRDGEKSVAAVHIFDERHVGAPGIAHGGAVAMVLDDLFGFLLYSIGTLAVTRKLEVEYVRPVRLDVEYRLRANIAEQAGRKVHMNATLEDIDGTINARSVALFLAVEVEHFTSHGNS